MLANTVFALQFCDILTLFVSNYLGYCVFNALKASRNKWRQIEGKQTFRFRSLRNGVNWLNKQIDSLQRYPKHLFFEVNVRTSVPLSLQGKTRINGNQRKILGIGSHLKHLRRDGVLIVISLLC